MKETTTHINMVEPTNTSSVDPSNTHEDHSIRRRLSALFTHPSQAGEAPHATDAAANSHQDQHPSLLRRLSASMMTPIPSGGLPYTTQMMAADNDANLAKPAAEAQAAHEHSSFLRRLSHSKPHAAAVPATEDEPNATNERLGFLHHVPSTHTSHVPVSNAEPTEHAEHAAQNPTLLRRLSSAFSQSDRKVSLSDSGPFITTIDPKTGHALARKNPHWPEEDSWKIEEAIGTKAVDGYVPAPGLT